MQFFINPADELPIYRQIMRQITEAIAGNRLKPGERLPSHRDLAEQLVVAPLTVKKAYDELEALRFIETQRGRGTFVRAELPERNLDGERSQLVADARRLLSNAYLRGLQYDDVLDILAQAEREITGTNVQLAAGRSKEE